MGQKSCEKCGELVDEAKAFCPACGNSFVEEEQRGQASAFEQMDSTVQMGQTMYGQMLSDMGLNISKGANKTEGAPRPENRVEVLAPIAAQPAAPTPSEPRPAPPAKRNYLIWIIVGAAALVLLLAILVVVIAVVFFYLNR